MPEPSFQTVRLCQGRHESPEGGVCVVELASMIAGERFSDHPWSVSPVIAAFLRGYNDVCGERRQDLLRCAADAVGTRVGGPRRARSPRRLPRALRPGGGDRPAALGRAPPLAALPQAAAAPGPARAGRPRRARRVHLRPGAHAPPPGRRGARARPGPRGRARGARARAGRAARPPDRAALRRLSRPQNGWRSRTRSTPGALSCASSDGAAKRSVGSGGRATK